MLRKDENSGIREKVLEHVREQIADASEEQVLGWIDRGYSRDHSDRFWTLDPIDGTKGFLRGASWQATRSSRPRAAFQAFGALGSANMQTVAVMMTPAAIGRSSKATTGSSERSCLAQVRAFRRRK